jgi:hypothetical protein
MQLDETQVYAVQHYLQRIPDTHCALCHQQEWRVSQTVFVLTEYVRPSPAMDYFGYSAPDPKRDADYLAALAGSAHFKKAEPEVFPVIPIVCGRCGFVFLLSAVAAGVVKR